MAAGLAWAKWIPTCKRRPSSAALTPGLAARCSQLASSRRPMGHHHERLLASGTANGGPGLGASPASTYGAG